MFRECKSLKRAPELPAEKLALECYNSMFLGCENLSFIQVGCMTLAPDSRIYTYDWVKDVLGEGTFIFPCGSTYDERGESKVPANFKIVANPIAIFMDADSMVLMRDTIQCGTAPQFKGLTPKKSGNDRFVYQFKGWDPTPKVLTVSDTFVYVAAYDSLALCDTTIHSCYSYSINGRNIMRSSEWTDTTRHMDGNDSIIHYQVFIHYGAVSDSSIFSCDPYEWRGTTI